MNSKSENNDLINLIVKKLSGDATSLELSQLDQALGKSDKNQKLYHEMEKTWLATEKVKGQSKEEVEQEWKRLETAIDNRKTLYWSQWMKVAASIVLIISVTVTIYLLLDQNQVELRADTNITNQLEDGSTVVLKAGSTLKYPEEFDEDQRKVFIEGEAFFEVSEDAARPFIVETNSVRVRVVGTSFNVRSDGQAEVMVSSGIVEVQYDQQVARLQAGEVSRVDPSNDQLITQKNTNPNILSWKTMAFTFEDTPLTQVVSDLNRAYQSNISLEEDLSNCSINVSFKEQSLESIINVLEATLGLSIKRTKGEIILSGNGC